MRKATVVASNNKKLWILAGALPTLLLLLAGCNPGLASNPDSGQKELVLSDTLIRNCKEGDFANENVGLPVGEKAINFSLKDLKGNETSLAQLLAEKPVLMIFGSFT